MKDINNMTVEEEKEFKEEALEKGLGEATCNFLGVDKILEKINSLQGREMWEYIFELVEKDPGMIAFIDNPPYELQKYVISLDPHTCTLIKSLDESLHPLIIKCGGARMALLIDDLSEEGQMEVLKGYDVDDYKYIRKPTEKVKELIKRCRVVNREKERVDSEAKRLDKVLDIERFEYDD